MVDITYMHIFCLTVYIYIWYIHIHIFIYPILYYDIPYSHLFIIFIISYATIFIPQTWSLNCCLVGIESPIFFALAHPQPPTSGSAPAALPAFSACTLGRRSLWAIGSLLGGELKPIQLSNMRIEPSAHLYFGFHLWDFTIIRFLNEIPIYSTRTIKNWDFSIFQKQKQGCSGDLTCQETGVCEETCQLNQTCWSLLVVHYEMYESINKTCSKFEGYPWISPVNINIYWLTLAMCVTWGK